MNTNMKIDPTSKEFEAMFKARYEELYPVIGLRRLPGDRN
jgi:hypothetical protein